MSWWLWSILGVAVWLYLSRAGMRWELEEVGKLTQSSVWCWLCLMPIGLLFFGSSRLRKVRLFRAVDFDNQEQLRRLLGESKWHKRERLAKQTATAEKELGFE